MTRIDGDEEEAGNHGYTDLKNDRRAAADAQTRRTRDRSSLHLESDDEQNAATPNFGFADASVSTIGRRCLVASFESGPRSGGLPPLRMRC